MTKKKKETSLEIAYNKIIDKIINEKLRPGTPLREDHLAAEFGLSSTPVREAFRKLEHEGWVESFPYKGTYLKKFSREEIKDIYLLREALECIAIGQAMQNATANDWDKIAAALDAEKKYIGQMHANPSDVAAPSFGPDLDFHSLIAKASHSNIFMKRCGALQMQLSCIMMSMDIKTSFEDIKETYEEHNLIYSAMRRGWVKSAEELIRSHIQKARIKHLAADNGK
jgi:DNA-binding GntR family transcriptional regulator